MAPDDLEAASFGTIVAGGRTTTGDAVAARAAGLADWIAGAGARPGDRVALITDDTTAFCTVFAACFHGAFSSVVIDPHAAPGELRRMLEVSRPFAIVADAQTMKCLDAVPDTPAPACRILVNGEGAGASPDIGNLSGSRHGLPPVRRAISLDAIEPQMMDWEPARHDDSLAAYVVFTSGTTSRPKGVVISRRALIAHLRTLSQVFEYGPQATMLNYLPLHHTDGLVHGPAAVFLSGMSLIHPGAFSVRKAQSLPHLLQEARVTHFLAVPTILSMVHQLFAVQRDLFTTPWFRHVVSTAGHLPDRLWSEFETAFDQRVSNFYGMTETVSGAIYCGPDDSSYRRGTLGRPVDCEVRIVDDQGAVLTGKGSGGLEISGPHLMDGYLDEPQDSAALLRDGWMDTGDIVRRNEDGTLAFVGRRKAVIKRGGIAIHPEDVRSVLEALDWVFDVEVIGAPDPVFEEVLLVCAVVADGKTEMDLRAACRASLAPERRPDRIILLPALPRGPSGKVRKGMLLEQAMKAIGSAVQPNDDIGAAVLNLAENLFQVEGGSLQPAFTADNVPNWDSYAHMELMIKIEDQFAVRLTPAEMMGIDTLGDAIEIVSAKKQARRDGT